MQILSYRFCLLSVFLSLFLSGLTEPAVRAQEKAGQVPETGNPNFIMRNINLSGYASAYGQAYHINGRESRRPPATGRVMLRPTLTLMKTVKVRFDLMYSSEGVSYRQNINRFAVHPRWSWGQLHAGDFSHSMSQFTMRGVTIRGGGLELYPGWFRFSVFGGQAQRRINQLENKTYERRLYAAKIGIGKQRSSFFDIVVVRAMDNRDDLPVDSLEYESHPDTLETPRLPTTNITSPEENMVVAVQAQLRLFKKHLLLKGEAAGCAYTRDTRSDRVEDEGEIPAFLEKIYTPRMSSSADYAWTGETTLRLGRTRLSSRYRYVGPGFVSLGLSYMINDREDIQFSGRTALFNNRLSLNSRYQQQSDNLLDQKRFTTRRELFNTTATLRLSRMISVNLNGQINRVRNDAVEAEQLVDFSSQGIGLSNRLRFGENRWINGMALAYRYQTADDKNPLRQQSSLVSQNFKFSLDILRRGEFIVTPGVGLSDVERGKAYHKKTATYSIRIRHALFDRKLRLSASFAADNRQGVRTYSTNLGATYLVWQNDTINLNVRSISFKSDLSSEGTYDESFATLNFQHRL